MMRIEEYRESLEKFLDRCNMFENYTVNAFVSDKKQVEEFHTKILKPILKEKSYANIEVDRNKSHTIVKFPTGSTFTLDIADNRFAGNHTNVLMVNSSVEDMSPFYGCIVEYINSNDVHMLNPKPIFFDLEELDE